MLYFPAGINRLSVDAGNPAVLLSLNNSLSFRLVKFEESERPEMVSPFRKKKLDNLIIYINFI